MKVASPHQYGLPEKFASWRPGQEEALIQLERNTKRVMGLCAPTGFGKSAVIVAHAIQSGLPTAIVTSTRGLQNQYLKDFASIGLVDLRGRRNYKCDMKPDDPNYTCEEGYESRCPYKGTVACSCSQAEIAAGTSNLVVTNYDKWCSARRFGLGLSHIQQVIFDEGHHAPQALASAMQVVLNHREVVDGLKLDFPGHPECEEFSIWKAWASIARVEAERAMLAARQRIQGVADPKASWVRHYTHMRNLTRRLSILAMARAEDWIVDEIDNGSSYQFDPVRPARYAEAALLLQVPKIVVISATLRPKTLHMIGVGKENYNFTEFDSDFDPRRCPTYYIPTMRVDKRANDLSMLWVRLDQVAAKRRDRKGIIHTVSYQRQQDILGISRFADSMIINEKGEPPTDIVDAYKASGPGTILVSPSVGTGYDFPGRDCEWQFICKIPFEPPSKIVKARERDDPEYRSYQAMQSLVQAFGRGVRSKEDQCENFIGDCHLDWFLPRYGHLAPRSFHNFFRRVDVVPQPPARL